MSDLVSLFLYHRVLKKPTSQLNHWRGLTTLSLIGIRFKTLKYKKNGLLYGVRLESSIYIKIRFIIETIALSTTKISVIKSIKTLKLWKIYILCRSFEIPAPVEIENSPEVFLLRGIEFYIPVQLACFIDVQQSLYI